MIKLFSPLILALKIWILMNLIGGIGLVLYTILFDSWEDLMFCFIASVGLALVSAPLLLMILIILPIIEKQQINQERKIQNLILACVVTALLYGVLAGTLTSLWSNSYWLTNFINIMIGVTIAVIFCSSLAILLLLKPIKSYFSSSFINIQSNQSIQMETTTRPDISQDNYPTATTGSNKTMIKGIITGVLILIMMIPTVFIANLVSEREARQKEVAAEVSNKWATSQTLTGPYIYIPYKTFWKTKEGKVEEETSYFWILPDNLQVTGKVNHEMRPRSIYKVLLYRAGLQNTGNFLINIPKDIDTNNILWNEAKICYGLSDFKGIEEKLTIQFNGIEYELSPGLPSQEISNTGLSVPISLQAGDISKSLSFNMKVKLKGSEQLHFVPLSGNSNFALESSWPNPSFDGNNLPIERQVGPTGFTAKWSFNKANLPFGTILRDFKFDLNTVAFGVTMLQPADQYAKISRSVKYAILFIGLTFGLFFILELLQKKPVHPVQYILIGLGLVIFYTLLLSISEFIIFDYAYLIASLATILLITLYARGHFQSWKSAGIFGGVLTALYSFIFVLIRLEDTALLVGSIGLFIVLAIVMYASRKINWYGTPVQSSNT